MHLPLKEYQERTLETLTAYYQNCLLLQNANAAFYDLTQRPYASVRRLDRATRNPIIVSSKLSRFVSDIL